MSKAMIDKMVDRFLSWKLPNDFAPDAGISFKAEYGEGTPWPGRHEPLGTNLLTAEQAKEMIEHMLVGMVPPEDLTVELRIKELEHKLSNSEAAGKMLLEVCADQRRRIRDLEGKGMGLKLVINEPNRRQE